MNANELIELVPPDEDDPRVQAAIAELRQLIEQRYPAAIFEVVRGDDPDGIYLIPTIDVDDLEEAAAVFENRLIDMQVEEGLPVYVFPDWPIERVLADLQQRAERRVEAHLASTSP